MQWAQYPYWTVDEAIALSFGKNPKLVNWFIVQSFLEIDPFAQEYAALRDLILRAVDIEELAEKMTPYDFVEWIKPRLSSFPNLLAESVNTFTESTAKPFSKSAYTNEMNTLLLLIYGVAVKKFHYTPEGNNSAATNMLKCIEDLEFGLSVTHSVVLNKIRKGEALLHK